jgi:hypothetical protein
LLHLSDVRGFTVLDRASCDRHAMNKADMQVIPFVLRFSDLQDGPTQIIAEWSLLDREIPLTQVFHLLPVA